MSSLEYRIERPEDRALRLHCEELFRRYAAIPKEELRRTDALLRLRSRYEEKLAKIAQAFDAEGNGR